MRIGRVAARCALTLTLLSACKSPRPASTREIPRDAPPTARAPTPDAPPAASLAPKPERWVRLVATHPLGVPLHPAERAQEVSGRLPDGSRVRVLGQSADGRWLEVLGRGGQHGWITTRYAPELRVGNQAERVELESGSAYYSRESCDKRVAARRAARPKGLARVMSYNVRRFPDGERGRGTDVAWLACVIASSNADVVAVQEFKNRRQAPHELDALLARLDALTAGHWVAALDECPGALHVGVLYDAARVQASSVGTYPSLNPHGEACKDQLRPGFGGYFRFPGGFDTHVISVHLKSAPTRRALDLRRRSIAGLQAAIAQAERAHRDADVIVVGDLNSMGCPKCSPELTSAMEIAKLDTLLATTQPAMRRVPAEPACSHYYHGEGTLLDHFIVSKGLRELSAHTTASVSGYCGELHCQALGRKRAPSAYDALSDHCPLLLDFTDRDLD